MNNCDFEFLTDKEILEKAKPLEYSEKILLDSALKILGEVTSVKEMAKFLGVSKGSIYKYIDERKILTFKMGSRIVILTKSILNVIRAVK